MNNISASRILSERLCLVCVRDGVAKPVQEHPICDEHGYPNQHFVATLAALEGMYVQESYINGVYAQWADYKETREAWCSFIPKLTDADLWRMACEVGGFEKRWAEEGIDSCYIYAATTRDSYWYNTPKEAVQRAYMEQLWDNAKGANG